MKKSTLALGVVAVLATTFVGGSWFVGKQLEQHSQEFFAGFTQEVEKSGMLSVKNIQLDRGWFSSDLRYTLEFTGSDSPINGSDRLYHGPFPLNRLGKFQLAPVLGSGEHHLSRQDEAGKAVNFAEMQSNIGFNGKLLTSTKAVIFPLNVEGIKTSEIHYQGDFSGFGEQTFSLPSLELQVENSRLTLKNLTFHSDFKRSEKYPLVQGVGEHQTHIEQLDVEINHAPVLRLAELKIDGNGDFEGERLDSFSELTAKLLKADQKVGDFTLKAKIRADNAALEQVARLENSNLSPEQALQALFDLAAKGFQLDIQDFSFSTPQGKSLLALNLLAAKENAATSLEQADLKMLDGSQLRIELNEASTKALIAAFADPASAELLYQNFAAFLKDYSQQAGGKVSLNLSIQAGKPLLNGTALSDEQQQMLFFLLLMAISA